MDNNTSDLLIKGEKTIVKELEKISSRKAAMIISGGIDSSTLFALALKHNYQLVPYGLISSQSQDLPYLKIIEKELSVKINYINIDTYPANVLKKKISFYREALAKLKLEASLTHISIAVGFDLLFQEIARDNFNQVVTAQGPDILLGGYHKYKDISQDELKKEIKEDLKFLEIDILRDSFVGRQHNLSLINPYLSQSFINFSLSLPVNLIRQQGENKYFLRLLAKKLGLPSKIVHRPKKAFQYSTRLAKILQRL